MGDPETEELRVAQVERTRREHDRARGADDPAEERQHVRRADKAAYLKAKLDEGGGGEEGVQRVSCRPSTSSGPTRPSASGPTGRSAPTGWATGSTRRGTTGRPRSRTRRCPGRPAIPTGPRRAGNPRRPPIPP